MFVGVFLFYALNRHKKITCVYTKSHSIILFLEVVKIFPISRITPPPDHRPPPPFNHPLPVSICTPNELTS